jgi:hypothetical protein
VPHGIDGVFDRRVRGHENDRRVRRLVLDPAEHREPVAVWQAVVEQDQVNARDLLQRSGCRPGLDDGVSVRRQPLAQRPADQFFVINNE